MIIKEITTKELHFDNPGECDDYMKIMKKKGYKIVSHGNEDDWYFSCKKEE